MMKVPCQKSSHVHSQAMEDAQEEMSSLPMPLQRLALKCPLLVPCSDSHVSFRGSRMHKFALSPQGVTVS